MYIKFLIGLVLCSSIAAEDNETTTTTEPTITTTIPTTTIATTKTTSTTTSATSTTTEVPVTYSYYNVTANNVTCIMIDGNFTLKVEYSVGNNKTNTVDIGVPKPSSDVKVSGSCKMADGSQYIEVQWGKSLPQSNIKLMFTEAADKWTVSNISSIIYMDAEHFPNGTEDGKSLSSEIVFSMAPHEVPVNKSYKCYSSSSFNNITTTEENVTYPYRLELLVQAVHLQAFNMIPKKTEFVEEVHCDADKIADIVPIAVGCALAGLIIVVLIAYIIGRRRRSASYQSV